MNEHEKDLDFELRLAYEREKELLKTLTFLRDEIAQLKQENILLRQELTYRSLKK